MLTKDITRKTRLTDVLHFSIYYSVIDSSAKENSVPNTGGPKYVHEKQLRMKINHYALKVRLDWTQRTEFVLDKYLCIKYLHIHLNLMQFFHSL